MIRFVMLAAMMAASEVAAGATLDKAEDWSANSERTKIVRAGDSMLKTDGVVHGCVCLEAGKLLDIFNPYRKDFVDD